MQILWTGGKKSACETVIAELDCGKTPGALPDFSDTMVIVPGRQVLRTLREALVAHFPAGVFPPVLQTPGSALHFGKEDQRGSTAGEQLFLWERVLRKHASSSEVALLMPERSSSWRDEDFSRMAQSFFDLRQELVRNGKNISDAAGVLSENDMRWSALARLETWFSEELQELKLTDPAVLDRQAAADPEALAARFRRVIVAFVPDLPVLLQQKLERAGLLCTVLVCAHEEERQNFDEWGRPGSVWRKRKLPLTQTQLHAAVNVTEAAKLALRIATENGEKTFDPEASAIVLGRPAFFAGFDGIFSRLHWAETDRNIRLFSPEGVRGNHLRISTLLLLLGKVMAVPEDFDSFAQLLRNPELLSRLLSGEKLSAHQFLCLLDEFTAECLPDHVPSALKLLSGRFAPLAIVFERGAALVKKLQQTDDLCRDLAHFLKSVFLHRSYAPVHGIAFEDEEHFWSNALYAFRHSPVYGLLPTPLKQLRYLLDECGRTLFYPVRPPDALPVFNFLELPALEQKQLLLIGINNGILPDTPKTTPFLTDTLRKKIGLPCSDSLAALENFKLHSLLTNGRNVHFIVLAVDEEHSPLRPSELLFQGCDDKELLCRATLCRAPETAPTAEKTGEGVFQLSFREIAKQPFLQKTPFCFSVTQFKSYLESPLAFLLEKVYGVEYTDYENRELPPNDFGSACHRGFEQLAGKECVSVAETARMLCAGADQYLSEKCGSPLPLLVRLQQQQIHSRLQAAAPLLAEEAAAGFQLLETEYSLNCGNGISLGGALIRGKIDRIELSRDRKILRLIDIKTYTGAVSPESDHIKNKELCNLQLPLYDRLLRCDAEFWKKHALDPEELTICTGYLLLTADPHETQFAFWEKDFNTWCEQAEEVVARIVRELTALRDQGILPPEKPGSRTWQLQRLLLPDAVRAVTMEAAR